MNDLPPEQKSRLSPLWMKGKGWNVEDEDSEPLSWLIGVGMALTLALILLMIMQFASINPLVRFGLLLITLAIAAMILVFRSYVRKDRRFPQVADEAKNQKAKNALQSTIESLDLAFDSDPYRQMLAIQELKDLSIDRLALRKRVPRSVAVEMASDPFWLKEEVEPEDLRLLLTSSAVRGPLVSENSAFADQYRRFLELVEEM